jgi:tetratricopeptide (TPR) repeat protein
MKKHLPLVFLLFFLFSVVGGTIWLIMTYPHRKAPAVRDYNLSQKRVQALKNQVVLFVEKKKYREAENFLRRIIEALPGNNKAVLMRGKVNFLRGEYALAEQTFRQVIIADPDNPVARNNLGVLLISRGLYESGIRELMTALETSGRAGYVLKNIYLAFLLSGNLPESQGYWKMASQENSVPPEEALLLLPEKTVP